jgi:hypothetical protein
MISSVILSHYRYHAIGVFSKCIVVVNGPVSSREWPVKLRLNGGPLQDEVEARIDDIVSYELPLEAM